MCCKMAGQFCVGLVLEFEVISDMAVESLDAAAAVEYSENGCNKRHEIKSISLEIDAGEALDLWFIKMSIEKSEGIREGR